MQAWQPSPAHSTKLCLRLAPPFGQLWFAYFSNGRVLWQVLQCQNVFISNIDYKRSQSLPFNSISCRGFGGVWRVSDPNLHTGAFQAHFVTNSAFCVWLVTYQHINCFLRFARHFLRFARHLTCSALKLVTFCPEIVTFCPEPRHLS